MTSQFFVFSCLFCTLLLAAQVELREDAEDAGKGSNRDKRLFNVLQVIRFPNDPCNAGGSRNGTCYTKAECSSRDGVDAGTCAGGFGICCIFSIGCGSTTNENCTYFEVTSAGAGGCTATICPCNDNICQLRLDFNTFVINGPTTATASTFKQLNGVPAPGGIGASLQTNCLTDTFSVTNPSGSSPPLICGTNSNSHMYVDSSSACNDLSFTIGSATSTASRSWSIKVTQYNCDYDNLAPQGCTQYFFGSDTGILKTYNFDGGLHLANQDQAICIRRERGNCRTCFSATTTADYNLSGPTALSQLTNSMCGGYGTNGQGVSGFDFLEIPQAVNANGLIRPGDRFCGRKKIGGGGIRCTETTPFMVRFVSDGFEHMSVAIGESSNQDNGFMLNYVMDADASCSS